MEESRRGFLKTLGKLATAVGIGFAAAGSMSAKAKIPTTPKAKILTALEVTKATKAKAEKFINDKVAEHLDRSDAFEFGFTGFKNIKTTPLSYEALEKTYQQAVDAPFRRPVVYHANVCLVSPRDTANLKGITD